MPQDIFETYADDYDRWFDQHQNEYLAELSRIRQVLPSPDSRSIEVGVGSGRFAAPLGIRIGIDPSRALSHVAHQRGIEVIRGKAEGLPIRDESCSAVLLVTVICFLDEPIAAFRELYRILLPGGLLIVAFIEREGKIHRKYLQRGGNGRFLSRALFYSQEEVRAFLNETGFEIKKVDPGAGFCVITAQKSQYTNSRTRFQSLFCVSIKSLIYRLFSQPGRGASEVSVQITDERHTTAAVARTTKGSESMRASSLSGKQRRA